MKLTFANNHCIKSEHCLEEDYQGQYIAENRVAALSRYFTGLAVLIGLPLAWYCMNRWLNSFAWHIQLEPGILSKIP